MTYRKTIQADGRVTLHDVSVFAACKRGGVDYDEAWLDRAVRIANAEERRGGRRPPVFVKHNGDFKALPQNEDADGLMANFRRKPVRVNGKVLPGIVVDLVDLTPEIAERVETNRLCGRSIETYDPKDRGRIDGVALLGRTAPFHALAQGSEPLEAEQQMFSLEDGDAGAITVFQEDFMLPAPAAPGAPAPAAPGAPAAPAAPDPMSVLHQIKALLDKALGGAAPAAPAPAPAAPAPAPSAAKMALDLEAEKLRLEKFNLETEKVKSDEALAASKLEAEAAQRETQIVTLFSELRAEGKCFSEDYVRDAVTRFGLDGFNEALRPLLLTAPLSSKSPAAPSASFSGTSTFVNADKDLAEFSAASPDVRRVAIEAAQEYDAESRRNVHFSTPENPRERFIKNAVRDFKNRG